MRYLAFSAAGLVSIGLVTARPASACSIASQPHIIDPTMQAIDRVAPTLPPISGVTVKRGQGPQGNGCEQTVSSCDDLGIIEIPAEATDDRTPPERIGYRFSIVAGAAPVGFSLPTDALEPVALGKVWLAWIDGAVDNQEAFDVTFGVVAIDLAGNESAPQTIRVQQGAKSGGCDLSARGATWPAALRGALLALLVMIARRPRPGARARGQMPTMGSLAPPIERPRRRSAPCR
jgi:hypothetical protein